jgi:hypothetical protein
MTRGVSLHIGVNRLNPKHYGGWEGPLEFCEADAAAIHEIAKSVGFEATLMLTADATLSGVAETLQHAASELEAGDIFWLSYAGHGGQLPDQRAGAFRDEDDRADETWCLFDGQLSDDEQSVLYAGFKPGVRVLVFSDSCHSGTVTRGQVDQSAAALSDSERAAQYGSAKARFRFMPRPIAVDVYRGNTGFYEERRRALPKERPEVVASVQLFSGCQDDQLSGEDFGHGFFTQAVLDSWDAGGFTGNYGKFHETILKLMPEKQQPNLYRTGQPNAQFENERPFSI